MEYSEKFGKMIIDCEPSPLYSLHEYVLPEFMARPMNIVCIKKSFLIAIQLINCKCISYRLSTKFGLNLII